MSAEPTISLDRLMNLWYGYYKSDGTPYVQRLQFLGTWRFTGLVKRIAATNERAMEKLPELLGAVDLSQPMDRWWIVCQLLEAGATLDRLCFETFVNASVLSPPPHEDEGAKVVP